MAKTLHQFIPGKRSKSRLYMTFSLISMLIYSLFPTLSRATGLVDSGLYIIPYPQQVLFGGDAFMFQSDLNIVLDKDHSKADEFTATELIRDLKSEWNIDAALNQKRNNFSVILSRRKSLSKPGKQGYELSVTKNAITISSAGEEGLFYGTQTLLQLIQKSAGGYKVIGLKITDWPDIAERAVHYDTKHHQDKMEYVRSFIKELARYKINLFVWEWEDKFLYPSHPEISAPGAFTTKEIQDLTVMHENIIYRSRRWCRDLGM